MKIKSLELTNFRGFEQATFHFHEKVNVLIGVNGAGKTSVLDALAILLDALISDVIEQKSRSSYFNKLQWSDVRLDELKTDISVVTQPTNDNNLKKWSLTHFRFHSTKVDVYYDKRDLLDIAYDFRERGNEIARGIFLRKNEDINVKPLPILMYYTENRVFNNNKDLEAKLEKVNIIGRLLIYEPLIKTNLTNFQTFESWYISEENTENRIRVRENREYTSPKLNAVRRAINLFFQVIDEVNTFEQLYVDELYSASGDTNKDLGLSIKKNNQTFRLKHLSEGERISILLISDIARRLTISSSHLEDFDALQGKGIVLIDEIELHLHPKWQRRIVLALTKVFPNVQFFLTTHSPQVLSSVPNNCVHIIEDFKVVENVPQTKGRDSNSILWDIFGVKERPEETQQLLDKFYDYLEDENQKDAAAILEKISNELGENDTAVQKAKLSYEFSF